MGITFLYAKLPRTMYDFCEYVADLHQKNIAQEENVVQVGLISVMMTHKVKVVKGSQPLNLLYFLNFL